MDNITSELSQIIKNYNDIINQDKECVNFLQEKINSFIELWVERNISLTGVKLKEKLLSDFSDFNYLPSFNYDLAFTKIKLKDFLKNASQYSCKSIPELYILKSELEYKTNLIKGCQKNLQEAMNLGKLCEVDNPNTKCLFEKLSRLHESFLAYCNNHNFFTISV